MFSLIGRPYKKLFSPTRYLLRSYSGAVEAEVQEAGEPTLAPSEEDYAYNTVEKKKGKLKPSHTVEEQIGYMKSIAFENAYKGLPVYKWYRRNIKTQAVLQPPPRLTCIDKENRIKMNNACPVCRDEYLFFDYRNPELIKQFLAPGTDKPIDLLASGLCREQYAQLRAQFLKAKEHGKLIFNVQFRVFDYRQYYPEWTAETDNDEDEQAITAQLFTKPAHEVEGWKKNPFKGLVMDFSKKKDY